MRESILGLCVVSTTFLAGFVAGRLSSAEAAVAPLRIEDLQAELENERSANQLLRWELKKLEEGIGLYEEIEAR